MDKIRTPPTPELMPAPVLVEKQGPLAPDSLQTLASSLTSYTDHCGVNEHFCMAHQLRMTLLLKENISVP